MTNKNKYTIFGNPIDHSKSPQMHNAGFELLKLDSIYDKTHLEDGSAIKDVFLSNNIQGANITVPHKEDAFKNADEIRGLAKSIGAVNTYINENGKVVAYNTDAPGFMKAIEEFGDIETAIILGAGGTAKAIAVAFKEKGIKTTVLNRSSNRLEFFKNLGCDVYSWEEYSINEHDFDIVVNSTSAGLKDDNYPAPLDLLEHILKSGKYAIDCIYGKMTPFLNKAKDMGLIYKDGEDMLLYQGVIAFEYFTGTKADDELIETMRKGLKG
ncbi:MAG: shikimate dehydrogenase, partial [Campylobacterota bacterium]|nr:shikimate dehydrogenase [Campylobacterota bacterium]